MESLSRRRTSAFTYVAERSLGLRNDFQEAQFMAEARDMQAATRNYIYDGGMRIWSMELDPVEERYLLVGTAQSTLALYDLKALDDKDDAAELLASKPSAATAIAHYDTSNRLPACSLINTHLVRRQDNASGRANSSTAATPPRGISCVDWYPVDGGLVVTSGVDGVVKVWDADVFCVETEFSFPDTKVFGAKFSRVATTHSLIAAVTSSHEVRLCDLSTESAIHSLLGHRDQVWALAWSLANEFQLATGSRNGEIRFWDIRRSGATACLLALNQDGAADVPGRSRGSSSSISSSLTNVKRPTRPMTLQAAATASSSSRSLTSRQRAERQRQEEQQQHKRRRLEKGTAARSDPHQAASVSLARAHSSAVNALAFTPDGRFLLSSGHDDKLRLWHGTTGEHLFANYEGTVSSKVSRRVQLAVVQEGDAANGTLVFHPNGTDGELAAFAVHGADGKAVSRYTAHYRAISACCYRKTRRELFTGGVDGLIMKWKPRACPLFTEDEGDRDGSKRPGDNGNDGDGDQDAWSDDDVEDAGDGSGAEAFVPPILRS
ncbi:hypothetical protein PINS_up004507 [Pythium insidiosum]|nr:hypothetical protein PINS_up004507 [Pythium insidiosum]